MTARRPYAQALGAIALWGSLAALGVSLSHVPPLLLTGLGLLIGSMPAWPRWRQWRVSPSALALGIYGLFGYHLLLFLALRHAPPVQANLVNYLWPLLIVVLAPLLLSDVRWHPRHLVAALLGFAGAAWAIAGGRGDALDGGWNWGYLPAFGAAVVWATYSLGTRRMEECGRGFPTAAVGLFGLLSGVLSLLAHHWFEAEVSLTPGDWVLIALLGLGPLGAAFFLWDRALKSGDPRRIGVLSYLTPLLSTSLLVMVTQRPFSLHILMSAALIIGAAALAMRGR